MPHHPESQVTTHTTLMVNFDEGQPEKILRVYLTK